MRLFSGLLMVLTASFIVAEEDFTLQVEGVAEPILVDLPSNWEEGKSYPSIFFYHRTNGRPQTAFMREHAGEEDWTVVGMGYAERGKLQVSVPGIKAEVSVLKGVRDTLQKRSGLDLERVIISGYNKGGWMSELMQQQQRWVAGSVVLQAGHLHQLQETLPSFRNPTPMFIGVGRLYANYPYALRAKVLYQRLGAQVEMEVWEGVGHKLPREGSEGLREWLQLRLGKKPDVAKLEEEWKEMENLADYDRWQAVMAFRQRPFVGEAGWEERVDAAQKEIEAIPEIAREVKILKESRRWLSREIGKRTYQDLKTIADGFGKIVKFAGESPQLEAAKKDFDRTSQVWELAKLRQAELDEQQGSGETEVGGGFGTGTRGRRTIPLGTPGFK